MAIRVVVADDHQIIRQGLRLLFSGAADVELIGEAVNGLEAVELCGALCPDVVIMDIGMPEMNGLEATRLVHGQKPEMKIVALSMHNDAAFVRAMKAAGASGYVLKDAAFDELLQAVRTVSNGGLYFPESN